MSYGDGGFGDGVDGAAAMARSLRINGGDKTLGRGRIRAAGPERVSIGQEGTGQRAAGREGNLIWWHTAGVFGQHGMPLGMRRPRCPFLPTEALSSVHSTWALYIIILGVFFYGAGYALGRSCNVEAHSMIEHPSRNAQLECILELNFACRAFS